MFDQCVVRWGTNFLCVLLDLRPKRYQVAYVVVGIIISGENDSWHIKDSSSVSLIISLSVILLFLVELKIYPINRVVVV
jgi:hypothetical protein